MRQPLRLDLKDRVKQLTLQEDYVCFHKGWQRTLLIAAKTDAGKNKDLSKKSKDYIGLSLDAMLNGDKKMRIEKTANSEITSQLLVAKTKWESYKKIIGDRKWE